MKSKQSVTRSLLNPFKRCGKGICSLVALVAFAGTVQGAEKLTGKVAIDGSSTVFPISEAIAEEFQASHPDVQVTVGISGTGGGFKKFIAKEIDISDASRFIKGPEAEAAKAAGVEYIELPVAYDGLSILVNPKNKFVDSLTVEELKKIWEPESKIMSWKDVRAGFPDQPIKLYGAGHDSGTFDYFTEAINGKEKACRADYTASEDDNVLVQGISGDVNSLGFFGFAYYEENKKKLKLLGVDGGTGAMKPSVETIRNGTYKPLSRPLFIYVSKKAAERPEVKAFIKFYLTHAKDLVGDVGYVALPDKAYKMALERFESGKVGSVGAHAKPGMTIEELLNAEEGK